MEPCGGPWQKRMISRGSLMKRNSLKERPSILLLWFILAGLTMWFSPARAEEKEDKPTANVSVDVLSQYIWRGYALSRSSAVLQPSVTAAYRGFSLNVWGNFDTDQQNPNLPGKKNNGAKWNETDLTVAYTREIYGALSGNVGMIYYALDSVDDSTEVYAGLSYAFPWLTVTATGYREVSHYPGWWVQLDLARTFEFSCYNMTLDTGASFIYQISKDSAAYPDPDDPAEAFSGPLTGGIFAALNIPVWKFVTVSPKVGFWFPLSSSGRQELEALSWDSLANHIYGGIRISAAF